MPEPTPEPAPEHSPQLSFDYANLSGRPHGPLLTVAAALSAGVRSVEAQVVPYARAWQEHNRAAAAGTGPLWVVLGDSMAQGIGASAFDRGWPGQLARMPEAGLTAHRMVNLSISGGRVVDLLDRQLPAMERLGRPDLVTVLVGSNDLMGRRHRRALPDAVARLLPRLPRGSVIASQPEGRPGAAGFNRQVRAAARERGLVVAEFNDPRLRSWRGRLAADHFHPNDRGYAMMATIMAEALGVPEGHLIHRLAQRHLRLLGGGVVAAWSPQGRFADGAALIDGAVLEDAEAWGKHLFHRYDDRWLHVHLGLYGSFRDGRLPAPEPRGALRLRLVGDDRWLDLRGPIRCEVLTTAERQAVLDRLGPDPLRPDADEVRAGARIARSGRPLGALLLDQSVVAGVGNVYRAEVLFRHRLSPHLPGRELGGERWSALWDDLVAVMRAGVRSGRIVTTDPDDRERPAGRPRRVDAHYVYARAGRACRRCGTQVCRDTLAARALFWCPRCQPHPAD